MSPCRRICAVALLTLWGCSEPDTTLVVELVPNPEVNTRADVAARVSDLEVVLDAEEGFAGLTASEGDRWGHYFVTDHDDDGALELVLTRSGADALEPFALTPGSDPDQLIHLEARGLGPEGSLVALGGATGSFRLGDEANVELPFNLLPAERPLRVLSMTPPSGARDLEPPVTEVSLQLGGEVLADVLEPHLTLGPDAEGDALIPQVILSYVDTTMGRMTNLRLLNCAMGGGAWLVALDTEICTTTGQCLDQHLGVEGAQPFEGRFTVRGEQWSGCDIPEIQSFSCPDAPCEPGYHCIDGLCVLDDAESLPDEPSGTTPGCDPDLCQPPAYVCDPQGQCVADCRLFGACPDPRHRCDPDLGLCLD